MPHRLWREDNGNSLVNILILGLNYAPEPIGIGPYTTGMAEWLAKAGHQVSVVCGKPYYPQWKVDEAFARGGVRRSVEQGVRIARVPLYVPEVPTGKLRLLHHMSFALRALPEMIRQARHTRPDLIITVAPSLIASIAARSTAWLFRARYWLHVQDFEVEAAFATGLLSDDGLLAKPARMFEQWSLRAAHRVSSISPQMCVKLHDWGFPREQVIEFRNWANVGEIKPQVQPSVFRERWSINRPHVALYSGNIANKQGIEIVIEAARRLSGRKDIMFVVCGNGPNREKLMEDARDLDNIQFHDLQPREDLSELLGLASVHLLPQIADAADLVLPSKLTNMLASGRAIIATADKGTGLANEVEGCGIITVPDDGAMFATAIEQMLGDDALRERCGANARQRALDRWQREAILDRFTSEVEALGQA
jgi:colanic acid biosynthesis glycosyl transferase WcaI